MKPRLLLPAALAVASVCALAFWPRSTPQPAAPEPPPVATAPAPEKLRLEQRLRDADAVLIRSASREASRRLDPPLAIMGGAVSETAPWFARLQIRHPDGSASHCGGTLMRGGWIVTAAHCVAPSGWLWIEASLAPESRASWGLARYRLGEAAIHRLYEGRDSAYRQDVALLRLPEDPGEGLAWPQALQTELELGEAVKVCGMGLEASGRLSEVLRCADLPAAEIRPGAIRLDGSAGGFRQADSGGPALRASTGTPVGVISHFEGGATDRQWLTPFPAKWAAGIRAAWE